MHFAKFIIPNNHDSVLKYILCPACYPTMVSDYTPILGWVSMCYIGREKILRRQLCSRHLNMSDTIIRSGSNFYASCAHFLNQFEVDVIELNIKHT